MVAEQDVADSPLGTGRLRVREIKQLPDDDRERAAQALALRLDRPMTVPGLVFLLVVLADTFATDPLLKDVLSFLSWALWAVFAAEFCLRLYLAPHAGRFLRRNWWQVIFLVVPFLRFLRLFLGAADGTGRSAAQCRRSQLTICRRIVDHPTRLVGCCDSSAGAGGQPDPVPVRRVHQLQHRAVRDRDRDDCR